MKTLLIVSDDASQANDIADVGRVFWGQLEYTWCPPDHTQPMATDVTLTISEVPQGSGSLVTVTADGEISGEARESYQRCEDPLQLKRVRKRACKLAAYQVIKNALRRQPPWGALTGIRPTRLVYQRMEEGSTLPEALQWIGSTFDVTEPKIQLLEEIIKVQQSLPAHLPGQAELYLGIPFCVSRCTYCSFSSGEIGNGRLVRPYVDALAKEVQLTRRLMESRGLQITSVYVGGGTPTALPDEEFHRVLEMLAPIAAGLEWTVEAGRPDTITRQKLKMMKAAGVTRISVNPQTFHDETLQRIGRRHTSVQTIQAFEMAREAGFDDINMDLIAGLPGEDESIFQKSLQRITELKPDSLTVHSLAIKHASEMHLYGAPLPDGEMTARMMETAQDCAHALGLRPYYMYRQKYMAGALENVAYARAGAECLYNVRMMEEISDILAVGAGAISKRVAPYGGKILRAPNVGNIEEYIRRVDEMAERKNAVWRQNWQ